MEQKIKSLLVVADGVAVSLLTERQPVWVQFWTAGTLAIEKEKKKGVRAGIIDTAATAHTAVNEYP